MTLMSIKENLLTIKDELNELLVNNRGDKSNLELLAVSKTKPIEMLIEAYECGQRLFGENKVQEAEVKVPELPSDAIFHMIGHLQSNKVKKACKYFSCIQSVDSFKIANKINNCCVEINKVMDIYLEINISMDENKSGFMNNACFIEDFEKIIKLNNINIVGLMCIGAYVSENKEIIKSFNDLKNLSETLLLNYPTFKGNKLSMGMSSDYKAAIECGSTMVRIGSSIFGSRV